MTSELLHITHTADMLAGDNVTLTDICRMAETAGVPDNAPVNIKMRPGDYRGTTTVTITWAD